MRLCAALAVVLVALLVVTFKVVRRHPHHVAPVEAAVVEVAPAPAPVPRPAPRAVVQRPPPRMPAAPAPPAKIAGRLRPPDDVHPENIEVVAWPSGDHRRGEKGTADADGFRIEGLVTGQRYDVEFRGDEVRTLKLIGIVAPAEDLDVGLEERATIHIAVGYPRGAGCPIDSVFAHVGGGEDGEGVGVLTFNSDCRFELDAPVSAGPVTIVAEGDSVRFETTLLVPDHGDPEPICLNPPCRADPADGLARLRFILDGAAPDWGIVADARPTIPGAGTRYGCRSSIPTCEIEGVLPGDLSITVAGPGCGAEAMTISVVAGDNDISVPCPVPTAREEELGVEMPDPAPEDDGA
jgi:hypothetical protein